MLNDPEGHLIEIETAETLRIQAERILSTLTPREALLLRLRFGLAGEPEHTYTEAASHLGLSRQSVAQLESRALRKMRHPSRAKLLKPYLDILDDHRPPTERTGDYLFPTPVEVQVVIEQVNRLTPDLLQHLRAHAEDLERLPWDIFEHLVGEFLASQGWEDVRLVGRDSSTSADIYAAKYVPPLTPTVRLFVEVKRWRKKVGIAVITEVLGALVSERARHGWHAALVVSTAGFSQTRKFSSREIEMLGLDLKKKEDLLMWLADYKPSAAGLWLPSPNRHMPPPID
jgi:DNA-binding CsgD family transcriptional regulator